MTASRVMVGAHLLVFVNGFLYGQTTGIKWDPSTPRIARHAVDSIIAYGLDPGAATVNGSMQVLRLHLDGGLEGKGIVAPFHRIPEERFFSVLVVDRVSGARVFQSDHCLCTGQSWSAMARNRVEGSFSFTALSYVNEAEYS